MEYSGDTKADSIDPTTLRYALYARVSSEDKGKQIRSIPDQIRDCRKIAADLGLNVIGKPLIERKSAKLAGKRAVFNQLLRDIDTRKKYDAILTWAPDRLCRNMLEGGMIINMLDEGKLKDLRFYAHHFTNDGNGKLTLGILFSISKHFSDDLARKVGRGVDGNLREGKSSGSPKFGYDRNDTTGYYTPSDQFDIVQTAWHMRAEGSSLDTVVDYLKTNGYQRVTKTKKKTKRIILPSKTAIGNMFHDPFYYGVLVQAGQNVDLRRVMLNFIPMIEEPIYNQVQSIGYKHTRDTTDKKRSTFYPLHGFVYCAICNSNKHMIVGKNKGASGTSYLSYRCDNKLCNRKPRSYSGKKLFTSIYSKLDDFKLSDEAYERYSRQLTTMTDSKIVGIKQMLHSKQTLLQHVDLEIKERALNIGAYLKDDPVHRVNRERIDILSVDQNNLRKEIAALKAKVSDPDRIKLSKEEFLNLINIASHKMKAGTSVEKDTICRILFLNLHVDNEKVVSYHWQRPFTDLVEAVEILAGRGDRT